MRHKDSHEEYITSISDRIDMVRDKSNNYSKKLLKEDAISILYFFDKELGSEFNYAYIKAYGEAKIRPLYLEKATGYFDCTLQAFNHVVRALNAGVSADDSKMI